MDNSELYLGYIDQVDPLRVFWIYRSQDQVMYFSGNSLQHIYQYLSDKNKLSSLAQDTLLYFLSAAVDKASVSLEEFRAIYYARPGVSSASSISFDKRFNNVSSEINKFLNGYFIQTLWSDRDMQSFGFIKGSEPQKKRFVESIQGKEIKVFKLHAGMNLKSFAKGLSEREASILSGALRDIEKFWNEESKSTTSRVQKQPYDKCFINMDNLLAFEESATKVWIMTSDFWREDILEYESLGQLMKTKLQSGVQYRFLYSPAAEKKWPKVLKKYEQIGDVQGFLVARPNVLGMEIDTYTTLLDCKDIVIYEFEAPQKPMAFALNVPKQTTMANATPLHFCFADSAVEMLLDQSREVEKYKEIMYVFQDSYQNTANENYYEGFYLCFEYSHAYPGRISRKMLIVRAEEDNLIVAKKSLQNQDYIGIMQVYDKTITFSLRPKHRTNHPDKHTMICISPVNPTQNFNFLVGITGSLNFRHFPTARACVLVKLGKEVTEEMLKEKGLMTSTTLTPKEVEQYDSRILQLLRSVSDGFKSKESDTLEPFLMVKPLSDILEYSKMQEKVDFDKFPS